MERLARLTMAAAGLLLLAPGCAKREDKEAPAPKVTEPATSGTPATTPAAPTTPGITTPGTQEPATTAPARFNAEAAARKYEECMGHFNSRNWDAMGACYSDDAESEWFDSGMPVRKGRADIIKGMQEVVAGFPDIKSTTQLILVNGNNVAAIVHGTGTHRGPMKTATGEIAPTNKKYGTLFVHGVTFNDQGQATREWGLEDYGTMLGQLGLTKMETHPVMDKGWADRPEVVIASQEMTTENANVDAFKQAVEGWNKHDMKAITDMTTDDYSGWMSSEKAEMKGKKGMEAGLAPFWQAFPDVKMTPVAIWGAGDYLFVRATVEGTNTGAMGKQKATGKKMKMTVIDIARMADGKATREWVFMNSAAMGQQLGMK